jgi:hypothetical protein
MESTERLRRESKKTIIINNIIDARKKDRQGCSPHRRVTAAVYPIQYCSGASNPRILLGAFGGAAVQHPRCRRDADIANCSSSYQEISSSRACSATTNLYYCTPTSDLHSRARAVLDLVLLSAGIPREHGRHADQRRRSFHRDDQSEPSSPTVTWS